MLILRFDLRIPPFVQGLTPSEQYREFLKMIQWADTRGFDAVVLSEHHGVEDGYMPSPLVLAGAVLATTQNLFCSISALVLPLHDPLRVAEDIATLDRLAPGRLNVVIGVGYRPEEFEMFGRDRSSRGRESEAGIRAVLKAWEGETFELEGRRVWITPPPVSKPQSLLSVGGSVEVSARRAARLGLAFVPAVWDEALANAYESEASLQGFEEAQCIMPSGPGLVLVTRDPESLWDRIGENLLYDSLSYGAWQKPDQRTSWHVEAQDVEDLKVGGQHAIVTPEECVDLIQENKAAVFHPLVAGIDPTIGWETLQLVVDEVIPAISC